MMTPYMDNYSSIFRIFQYIEYIYIFPHHIHLYTSTAPGGGRSFNDRKL